MYGTFTILLGEGYLIGGESASEIYADVWKLNLNDFNWEPVLISGEYFGITRHAACTFSGSLIVFGGITNTGLSNKLYQYSLDGYLTEISNTAQATPSPRLGACMVSLNTSLYIFGGETVTGIFSPELWRFDFSNLTYTLIAEHFEGLAYHNCMVEENFLYAMFGKTNSGWYNLNVIRYNTSGYLEEWEIFSEFTEYTAWATVLLIQNEVIRIGGEIDGLASNEIAIIDLKTGDITEKQSMDWAVFGSASGTFNKTVYMIGGVQSIGNVPVLNPSYRNIQINIPELLCDPGTRSDGNTCRGCRAGTFSLKSNSLDCANCAEGTYNSNSNSDSNKYCLPCPNDKFGPNKGLDACFDCPSFSYCPVGAIQPQLKYTASLENSTNPNLSTSISSYNSISFALEILCIAVGVTLILLFLSNRTIRKWFKSTDIFKQNHNEKLGQPMILRKTEIGGCFTMLFITASIYLSLITLIYFFLENISISQALVPLVSIEQGYNRISGDISFNIFLKNFGADCPGDDTCSKLLTTTDISYSEFLAVCTSIEKTCSLYYKFKDCELGSFPKLELKISKEMCFVSSIEVNITAATGIQDTVSSTLVTISPDEDKVLIGNTPSILSLAVIYSVYNTGTSVTTGYYIISNTQPTLGSAYAPSNVPFYSTLFLDINLNKEDSALLTLTDLQQATQLIVTGLLGGVTGLLQIFSYLMDTTESVYNYAVGKIKNKRKINNISWHSKQLESNFDKESVLITRQSIRMADCSFSSNDITVEDIE